MRTRNKVIIGVTVAIVLIIVGIGIVGYLSTPTPTTVTTILPTVQVSYPSAKASELPASSTRLDPHYRVTEAPVSTGVNSPAHRGYS